MREQEQKDDVDGLSIDGIEGDWFAQPDKHSNRFADLVKSGVRQRDAAAHAGRSQFFPLFQLRKDLLGPHIDDRSGLTRQC